MPSLLLSECGTVRVVPLAPATPVGRAPTCLGRIAHESCPLGLNEQPHAGPGQDPRGGGGRSA